MGFVIHTGYMMCKYVYVSCTNGTLTRAKVNNAASATPAGQKWFKVAEDGLDSAGKWGVDRLIANNGWVDFTLPSCLAAGDYLLRAEVIALHSAGSQGQAQFYV